MIAPETCVVKSALERVLREKASLHHRDSASIDCQNFLDQFDLKCREWDAVTVTSREWRIEWAGKDILLCLSRWLAAEVGVCLPPNSARTRINWDALAAERATRGKRTKKDQEIERLITHELQPKLVKTFLEYLPHADDDVKDEWESLANIMTQAAATARG